MLCPLRTNEANWALLAFSPEASKKGLNESFCPRAGQGEHTHLASFSQGKKASHGVNSNSWVRKRERLCPKQPFQEGQSQHWLLPSLTGSLRSWWVPIPGNVRLSLTTRGCSPSQRQSQCHRCTQTARGAFISSNRGIWARGKLEN